MKFHVETFGCQMNAADSQEMSRRLLARGFAPAAGPADADVLLVNTCTVRQHAENKAFSFIGALKAWKGERPGRFLVVAGCAAERAQDWLGKRFPHVDLVAGAKSIDRFDALLDERLPFGRAREIAEGWTSDTGYDALLPGEKTTAHVTIMRGCNYACSYCIVPAVRGREIYRPAAGILAEVRQKAALGLSEVLLLGQTVNSYRPPLPNPGPDGREVRDFADLLRAVDAVPGVRRVRFMSPHPFYVDDRMVRAVAESQNVCPHVHLPVQSGADRLLKRMRRNYTRAEYVDKIARLRAAVPGLALTTDVIVGFPGETEDDFQETLSLIRESDFDGAYCFKYSPRPGTAAAEWTDDVPRETKEDRLARLLELTDSLARAKALRLVGGMQEVMVEGEKEGRLGAYHGRARDARVAVFTSTKPLSPGQYVAVRVESAAGRTLMGRTD